MASSSDVNKASPRCMEPGCLSLRAELTTIFGQVTPHHGMSWEASMLARIAETLAKLEGFADVLEIER